MSAEQEWLSLRLPRTPREEIVDEFLQGMIDRMAVGFHKYGYSEVSSRKLDYKQTIDLRWQKYQETGNTEYLMDIANFAMIEFHYPKHPNAHYKPTDSHDSPGVVTKDGVVTHETKPPVFHKHEGD